jgi:hypothetical protein
VGAFQREAITRLVAKATGLGVDVPQEVSRLASTSLCRADNLGALLWVAAHPEATDPSPGCCWGSVDGPEGCTCWRPVYDVAQARPRPPAGPDELLVQRAKCGDCAYRPGSPERATAYEAETLYDLAAGGTPFWCHTGMRRPVSWVHPDGREVPGDPADWQPPMVSGIPYQADGSPGLLCAGWAAIAAAHADRPGLTACQ